MDLLLGVLNLLFLLGCLVLVVVILKWGLGYLGISIPEEIMRVVWFLVIVFALILIVSFLAGVIHLPKVGFSVR
jgi:hypothetical protein